MAGGKYGPATWHPLLITEGKMQYLYDETGRQGLTDTTRHVR
jgi:hypothetical protein